MKTLARIFLLSLCFFFAATDFLSAQRITKQDTTVPVDSSRFYFFTEDGFKYGDYAVNYRILDRLDGFQDYHVRQAGLGNAGAPEKELFLPGPSADAFRRGKNSFNYFGHAADGRIFFTSEKPFTKLQYIVGQKQELNVDIIHAHPFGKNCNIAFVFDRTRSAGFYKRQNTNNTNIGLNGWYRAPGRRYAMLADIYWTTINVAENGGLENDSSFEFENQLDRQLVAVNLSLAETKQRSRGVWLKEYWSFGNVMDTISDKSDSTKFRTKIGPSWAIVHTVNLHDETYQYIDNDPSSGFYANIYDDSAATNDSTYIWRIENGIWLERFGMDSKGNSRVLSGKIGARHEAGEFKEDTIYTHFQNVFADGTVAFHITSAKWSRFISHAILNGWYDVSGYDNGDYHLKGEFGRFSDYVITAERSHLHPALVYTNYSGNNFRWKNDFNSSDISDVKISWLKTINARRMDFINVVAGWYAYDQVLYFDSTLLPAQYNGNVSAFTAQLVSVAGTKHFRTRSNITWNSIPSASPIRLPQWIVRESVYGDFHLFKSALQLEAGVDATWFSAYYADAYNPGIAQFYIQNTKLIENYIYLDPWLSIKVKPVRIFLKADHVNAGMFGRKYYLVPHYPQNDLCLKFGLSWMFND